MIDDPVLVVARAAHFAALAALVGIPLFRRCVADVTVDWLGVAAALAWGSALVWFLAVAAGIGEGWADAFDPSHVAAVALFSEFGRVWLARIAVLTALLALGMRASHERLRLGLGLAAAASLALTGHATVGGAGMSEFGGRLVHGMADAVHAMCATGWLGGLVALGLTARRANGAALADALPRFSRLGYVLVAGILVSGCVNAAMLIETPRGLVTTDYGRLLLAKLALVAAMLGLALVNRLLLTPRIQRAAASRLFGWTVTAETGLGAAVLATVAVLGTLQPHT